MLLVEIKYVIARTSFSIPIGEVELDSMSPSRSTDHLDASVLPTDRDLDRLVCAIRSVAREKQFPSQMVDRYESWILIYLSWAIKAPPHSVSVDRIGEFRDALDQNGCEKWKRAEAMDALGFLFGNIGGPENLYFSNRASRSTASQAVNDVDWKAPVEVGRERKPATRQSFQAVSLTPNPTLTASGSDRGDHSDHTSEDKSRYLPESVLPQGVDARAEVPTRRPSANSTTTPDPQSETDSANSEGPTSDSRPDGRDTPKTLFNPNGFASSSENSTDSEDASVRSDDVATPTSREQAFPHLAHQKNGAPDPPPDQCEAPSDDDALPKVWEAPASPDATNRESDQSRHEVGESEDKEWLEIPQSVADRLKKAAHQLGLPPAVFAARAIDLVCEDAGIGESEEAIAEAPLDHYQAQLDLLHLKENDPEENGKNGAHRSSTGGPTTGKRRPKEQSGSDNHGGSSNCSNEPETNTDLPDPLPLVDTLSNVPKASHWAAKD